MSKGKATTETRTTRALRALNVAQRIYLRKSAGSGDLNDALVPMYVDDYDVAVELKGFAELLDLDADFIQQEFLTGGNKAAAEWIFAEIAENGSKRPDLFTQFKVAKSNDDVLVVSELTADELLDAELKKMEAEENAGDGEDGEG